MHTDNATPAPQPATHEPSAFSEWRELWALEDGQPAWLRDSVAMLDAQIQGEMGHS